MRKLPTEEEQHWLLVSMAALIRARGHEQFLANPIVEPTREYFPDPWGYSLRGLDRVVRRLMQYASLAHLDVEVTPYSEHDEELPTFANVERHSTAGLFFGIEGGRCRFGFNTDAPADDEFMVGVMCHEVAHAYRAHHGLAVRNSRDEELLTDLTACYLGFGVLAANNSYLYRTSMDVQSGTHHMLSHGTGYLTPQALSYLLGLQMAVRDLEPTERRRVYRHLEHNQSAYTRASFEECRARSRDFPVIFGLPPRGEWPDPTPLEKILSPLPEFHEETVDVPPAPEAMANRDRPVFRVRRNKALGHCLLGLLISFILGTVVAVTSGSLLIFLALPSIGLFCGLLLGLQRHYDVCSDPACSATLDPEAADCPGCGGTIMGRIASQSSRLDAEAELHSPERMPKME